MGPFTYSAFFFALGIEMTDNVEFEGIDLDKTKGSVENQILGKLDDLVFQLKIVNVYLSMLTNEEITEGDMT